MTLAAASAAILASAPAQYFGRQQDDLLYFIGAHSLLEGKFRLLTAPGQPPLYMINPGFPALLAPLAFFAGERPAAFQVFCALLLAACPWAIWLWLRKRQGAIEALLVCAIFSLSPLVLSQAGTVMSEAPFLLATLALLWALEAPDRAGGAAASLLAAVSLRTAAVSLAPAALARPLSQGRWKDVLRVALPSAATLALWSAWSRATAGAAQQKLEELAVSYSGRLARVPAVAWENASYYLSSWGASYLPPRWASGPAALALGLLLCAAAARGGAMLLHRDKAEAAVWVLGGTAVLHLLWPWHYERYLIMPLPLLLWCASEGLSAAARPVLAALLAAQVLFQSPAWIRGRHGWLEPELAQTYEWIRTSTTDRDIVASAMYVRDGFYAQRPALPLPPGPDEEAFFSVLKTWKVRYVLWQDGLDLGLSVDTGSAVRERLDRDAKFLGDGKKARPVYENPTEHARVFELL